MVAMRAEGGTRFAIIASHRDRSRIRFAWAALFCEMELRALRVARGRGGRYRLPVLAVKGLEQAVLRQARAIPRATSRSRIPLRCWLRALGSAGLSCARWLFEARSIQHRHVNRPDTESLCDGQRLRPELFQIDDGSMFGLCQLGSWGAPGLRRFRRMSLRSGRGSPSLSTALLTSDQIDRGLSISASFSVSLVLFRVSLHA